MFTKEIPADIANLVKAKGKAQAAAKVEKTVASTSTKGLTINGRPATFTDLTPAQLRRACDNVNFNIKLAGRDVEARKADAIANALLKILENPTIWDSTKKEFYFALLDTTNLELRRVASKTSTKREATSYSVATSSDNEETEFNYTSGEYASDMLEDAENVTTKLAKFNELEKRYINLVLWNETLTEGHRFENEDIAEQLGFVTYGNFRTWVSRFKTKHNLTEAIKADVTERTKAQQNETAKANSETAKHLGVKAKATFQSTKKVIERQKELEMS